RWASAGPSSPPQERDGTGARGAAHRGRVATPARHRRARDAPRQGERADPSQLLFERGSRAPAGAHAGHAVRRMRKRLDRRVTIVVHTDGDLASRQYRVPVWALEAGKWSALVVGLLVVLFFTFAGPISRAAARVPGLQRQVARLEGQDRRVQQLAAALKRARAND